MKCSELYRMLTQDGWYAVSQSGSHIKMRHGIKSGVIIFRTTVAAKWERGWK
jgi:predicted RNA binding protein YcfA (HicA-like mRNA interferase family)